MGRKGVIFGVKKLFEGERHVTKEGCQNIGERK